MNKRIRELAALCWDPRIDGRLHFDQEMFGELIIEECLAICADAVLHQQMADAAVRWVAEHRGAAQRTVRALEPWLPRPHPQRHSRS
jgi:hypothetical protein